MLCSAKKENPAPFQGGVKLMFASMLPLSCRRYAPKNITPHSVSIRNFPFSSKRARTGFARAEIGLNWLCNINPGNVHPEVDRFRKKREKIPRHYNLKTHHRLNPPTTAEIVERGLVSRVRKWAQCWHETEGSAERATTPEGFGWLAAR